MKNRDKEWLKIVLELFVLLGFMIALINMK